MTTKDPDKECASPDVAPSDRVEKAVLAIWAELLQVEHVGPHDSFLLLGGESLLAMGAVSRIRSQLNCSISVRSVLIGTVSDVVAEINAALTAK